MSAVFKTILSQVAAMFLEKEEQIEAILRCLLAGEHVLLLGPPGTAKSATVVELLKRITGINYYEYLLTKYSAPEEVFGPVSIVRLQQDKFERNEVGYLPWAHVGFLDEVFKANSAILNSLLTMMAERKFKQGTQVIKTGLISIVGASNETPQEDDLTALYDRFMVRKVCGPVSDSNFVGLLDPNTGKNVGNTEITLAEFDRARAEVATVRVPMVILEEIAALKVAMHHEAYKASDRRWRASVKLLQACAYLDGRDEVVSDDLTVYADVLWDDMTKAKDCASKVGNHINPALAKLLEHVDEIDRLLSVMVNAPTQDARIDAKQEINQHKISISKLSGRVGKRGQDALDKAAVKEKAAIAKVLAR